MIISEVFVNITRLITELNLAQIVQMKILKSMSNQVAHWVQKRNNTISLDESNELACFSALNLCIGLAKTHLSFKI